MKNTKWKLFLDDVRTPDSGCVLAKSVSEAVSLIDKNGFPEFISFDHDLGESVPTGKDFANIICEKILDDKWEIPENFSFQVHSDNNVGSENIMSLMNNFLKHINHKFQLKQRIPYSLRTH